MESKKRILSGIQPTGNLHFGRYFGAVSNWVNLQETYHCFYCVVDYHAMTMPFVPAKLRENSWELAINLLAAGIKPENLFIQSMVPEHTELSWIMSCYASYGQLSRMTQFKDKSAQAQESGSDDFISAALFGYPVLQAADILIYKAHFVPVGKDQEQHVEFTRNIAQRFNNQTGKEYFVLPEALFTEFPKIMSTADPTRKMSASLGEKHNIDVFADPDRIRKQVRSAVTDTGDTPAGTMSPGVENLFTLLNACKKQEAHDSLMADYNAGALKYVDLKEAVADALVEISGQLRERKKELTSDRKAVKEQLKASGAAIREHARLTLREVKDLVGLVNPR
ncbi:MAG TPA: tryptophan--tRNA ligase [Flavilitoribacter sp.]|nr:tryptophan--tRNA ligase [Flavilitoribacter sp.]HMQ88484.1 tryptophan--tRNA ligase [Flavilitoribacter sp.]